MDTDTSEQDGDSTSNVTISVSNEAFAKLHDQLTCSICLEHYTDARTLSCHHNYCKLCIDRLPTAIDGSVKCPKCRKATRLTRERAASLPRAFHVNNLLEIFQLMSSTKPQLCSAHNRPKDVFCETCEELTCLKCVTRGHQDHDIDRAVDLYDKHKKQLETCLNELSQKHDFVKKVREKFEAREQEIERQGNAVKQEIDAVVARLERRLKVSRIALQQKVDAAVDSKLKILSLEKMELSGQQLELESCRDVVNKQLSAQTQLQLLAAKKELVQRISEIQSKVKVCELEPLQVADIVYNSAHVDDSLTGSVQSTLNCSMFALTVPEKVYTNVWFSVILNSPISLPQDEISCKLESTLETFPFTVESKGKYKAKLCICTPGPHKVLFQLKNSVLDLPNGPFCVQASNFREKALNEFASGFNDPCGVASTSNGDYVVIVNRSSKYRYYVNILDRTGAIVKKFRIQNKGNCPSHVWGAMVSNDEHIVIALQLNTFKYWTFNFNGSVIIPFDDSRVEGDDLIFYKPCALPCHSFGVLNLGGSVKKEVSIAIGFNETIHAFDGCNKLMKFTIDGQLQNEIELGDLGLGKGTVNSICVDKSDILYIAHNNSCVVMMTSEGNLIGYLDLPDNVNPYALAVDNTRTLYVCDQKNGKVFTNKAQDYQ